jgi:hypothetical protein
MGNALDYLPAIAMGTKAAEITGVTADGFTATGYASLVQSITGAPPVLVPLPNRKARILLNPKQAFLMKQWLEKQVAAGVKLAKAPSNLELDTGPFIIPVVLKYAVPVGIVVFALGWLAGNFLGKR